MQKIKIITDSTCDLSADIIEKYNIEVLPILINFGEKSYLEGVEIDINKMLEKIELEDTFPTTAQVTPNRFVECFEKYLKEGYKIISIHISSYMSGTYQSACMAKQDVDSDDITVIDSKNVTVGLGAIVYKAARLIEEGKTFEEIGNELEKYKEKVRSVIAFESLDNLVRGGRLSKGKAMFVSALGIKLLLNVHEGEMNVLSKVRGNKKLVKEMIERFNSIPRKLEEPVILLEYENKEVYDPIKQYLTENNIKYITQSIGCAVGIHSGQNVCAVFYIEDYN